jgi:hypothetical protein
MGSGSRSRNASEKGVSNHITRERRDVLTASYAGAVIFVGAPCFGHGASLLSARKFNFSCGDWDTCDF